MRFWHGLILGAMLGGASVYAGLEKPWHGWLVKDAATASDAGVETAAREEPGSKRKRRRGRRPGPEAGTGGDGELGGAIEEIPTLTEADRALVWKGDAVALPPRQIDMTSDSEARALDGGEINAVIRAQSEPMVACIAEARGTAELDARITVEMLVSGQGQVTKTRVRAPAYLFAHGFQACARKAAQALRFPATGAPTVVTAPYDLH
jgi:hypothetical protein